QRLNDSRHRSPRKRFVATQLGYKFLASKNAAQHANGRTGVSAIERCAGPAQTSALSVNDYRRPVTFPVHPERTDATQSAGTVGAGRKIIKFRRSLSNSAEHRIAMRNRFVAGQADRSGNTFGGSNQDRSTRHVFEYNGTRRSEAWSARHPQQRGLLRHRI